MTDSREADLYVATPGDLEPDVAPPAVTPDELAVDSTERFDEVDGYTIVTYMDDTGKLVDKAEATRVTVRAFNSNDRMISETFGTVDRFDPRTLR